MTNRRNISMEEMLPLILSVSGTVGIFPFTIIRFLNGEWLVGMLDTCIVAAFAFLGFTVYRTGNVRRPSILLALLCVAGVLSTVYLKGSGQIYWAYPAFIAVFYLLKPREALLLAVVAILALIPPLIGALTIIEFVTMFLTMTVTASFAYAFALLTRVQRQKLVRLATRDPLTNAGNRRALDARLENIVAAHRRNATVASLLIIDLDHFKSVNDTYGHAAGDQILIRLTEIIQLRIRVTDSLYRIGGEEFVVLVEGQNLESASMLAEQLRTLVEVNELAPKQAVTISIGIAELHDDESYEQWLCRADDALYEAKRDGRNKISLAITA